MTREVQAQEYSENLSYQAVVYGTYGEGLGLMDTPDEASGRILLLPEGAELEIYPVTQGWGYTSYEGYEGWVSLRYLRTGPEYPSEYPSYGWIEPEYLTVYDTDGEGLELRSGPSVYRCTYGPMMDGTVLQAEAVIDTWAYVSTDGLYGWANLAFLRSSTQEEIQSVQIQQEPDEISERYEFVQPEDLILYLSDSMFYAGESGETTCTVLYGSMITEDITLLDTNGQELLILPNDHTGYAQVSMQLDTSFPCTGRLFLQSAEVMSAPVSYYVQPRIGEEMSDRLTHVSQDLQNYVMEVGQEDPRSESTVAAVETWLREDERIACTQRSGNAVLYLTTDGLAGSYNLGYDPAAGPVYGHNRYQSPEKALEQWKEGTDLSDTFLFSDLVLTNTDIAIIAPDCNFDSEGAHLVKLWYTVNHEILEQYSDQLGSSIFSYPEESGKYLLLEGGLNDFGMVVLMAHGVEINRSDGSQLMAFDIGRSDAFLTEFQDALWCNSDEYLGDSAIPAEDLRAICDVTADENGEFISQFILTGNYLKAVMADKIFDNTIVFLCVCQAMNDASMNQWFIEHGASAVIGCPWNFDCFYAAACLEELTRSLLYREQDGICEPVKYFPAYVDEDLEALIDQMTDHIAQSEDAADFIHLYLTGAWDDVSYTENEVAKMMPETRLQELKIYLRDNYLQAMGENHLVMVYPGSCEQKYAREALAEGLVFTHEGTAPSEPLEANVNLYRWKNHSFEKTAETSSDTYGEYHFDNKIPVGYYVLEAEREGLYTKHPAAVSLELCAPEQQANTLLLGYSLQGTVTDKETGEPLEGAVIEFASNYGNMAAATDGFGSWHIIAGEQTYQVQVSHMGYYPETREISRGDGSAIQSVSLTPDYTQQLQVLAQNAVMYLIGIGSPKYAVTDLDHNGRLEIFGADNGGDVGFTTFEVFEVNESLDGLVKCFDNFIFDETQLHPDICESEMINTYKDGTRYIYQFRDFARNEQGVNWDIPETLVLKQGEIIMNILESGELSADGIGQTSVKWVEEYDLRKGNIMEELTASWKGFGLHKAELPETGEAS